MRQSSYGEFTYDADAVRDAEDGTLREEVEALESENQDSEEVIYSSVEDSSLSPLEEVDLDHYRPPKPKFTKAERQRIYKELRYRDPVHKRTCPECLRRVPLAQITSDTCDECK